MQAQMNIKIKFREGFRPFAPSVLRERVGDYFELEDESPYMLLVAPVRKERQIPMTTEQQRCGGSSSSTSCAPTFGGTHIDYSARIQTVSRDTNPNYYDLIAAFEQKTGCAVLVNTSFNVRGEPIVCTRPTPISASCGRTSTTWCSARTCSTSRRSPGGRRRKSGATSSRSTDGAGGRKFAFTLGAAFLGLALWRASAVLASLGILLTLAGLTIPTRLAPVQRSGWQSRTRSPK